MLPVELIEIWRHPVKSLQGEQVTTAEIDGDGLRGDRSWGIRDEGTGRILTGRREPRLLLAAATLGDDGTPSVTLPDGTVCRGAGRETDAALSGWLGKPVTLVAATGGPGARAEFFADATDDDSQPLEWTMPAGRFVDAMPLLVLTTASLRAAAATHPEGDWSPRRFRPNLLVDAAGDGWLEDGWAGRTLRVGAVGVVPQARCERCTMVTRPQPGLERDLDVYRAIARHHAGTLGMWTAVATTGSVEVGAAVELVGS